MLTIRNVDSKHNFEYILFFVQILNLGFFGAKRSDIKYGFVKFRKPLMIHPASVSKIIQRSNTNERTLTCWQIFVEAFVLTSLMLSSFYIRNRIGTRSFGIFLLLAIFFYNFLKFFIKSR